MVMQVVVLRVAVKRMFGAFLTCGCPLASAVFRELERRQKTLEARAETERILADQAERVRQRKAAMDAQDAERARRLQQEAHERHLANLEKRKKAEQRITSERGGVEAGRDGGGREDWREGGRGRWGVQGRCGREVAWSGAALGGMRGPVGNRLGG